MDHFVIIGNGTAGNCAAEKLRERDKDIRITLISAEPTPYVKRFMLARYLKEDGGFESLAAHPPQWYDEQNIRLRLNQPVTQVSPKNKTILFAHRERISYDKLLIASGARHRIPEYLSHFESLLTRFSRSVDAIELKARLQGIDRVALLGGDFIGLQLLSALRSLGKEVTVIMDEYRFWPLEYDAATKDRLADALSKKGVEVVRDDLVADVEKSDGGLVVHTRGGAAIKTDAAVVCAGMVPCLEFLSDSGIDVQDGVLVNERLEASEPDVWAAGECAQIYHVEIKDYRCSTGYVNACIQGELAAANMLGAKQSAPLCEPGEVVIAGEEFTTYGWKGFSLDETD